MMRHWWHVILANGVLITMTVITACAAPIYVYPVQTVAVPLHIDGLFEEEQWQNAHAASGFFLYGAAEGTPAPVQTTFRLLYDDTYLYIGIICDEPEAATLSPVSLARDDITLFRGECVEVFIDPTHSRDLYYQFAVNPAGSLYDARRMDAGWDSNAVTFAVVGQDHWSVEIAIPWECLGVTPRVGAVVGLNINRQRHIGEPSQLSMWSRVRGFHDPERYGHLVLSGTPEHIADLHTELRKKRPAGSLVVCSPDDFALKTYPLVAAAAFDELEKLLDEAALEYSQKQDREKAALMGRQLAEFRSRMQELRRETEGVLTIPSWHTVDANVQQLAEDVSRMLVDDADAVQIKFSGHPRLFFSADELKKLQTARRYGHRAVIWRNIMESAEWCLDRPLRQEWIAPVSPDPIYANLYDRFYAMMHDMAVMEHLAFAYSYSGEERYGQAAVDWALACCRIWRKEAEGQPDGGKAYAVTRLLKGLAVSYDLLYDRLDEKEREELYLAITEISQLYYDEYFSSPEKTGPGFRCHHAIVEWASFGVASLAVLDKHPLAQEWLRATVTKFREHLLPTGGVNPADGAQTEGATFWASTMQYRIAFMDALLRITGEDLFTPFAEQMNARMALASIASPKASGHDQDHETVLLSPSYGQLNYYSPVMLGLARFYRDPLCQHLALWDQTAGHVQQTRYITDNGEWMLFGWGGYAYAWYDPTVPAEIDPQAPLSFNFPSVNEAYLRTSYDPGDIVVGMRRNAVVIHAGRRPVYADHYDGHNPPGRVNNIKLMDDGQRAYLSCRGGAGSGFNQQTVMLRRPGVVTLSRITESEQAWWCYGTPVQEGNVLRWEDGTTLAVKRGTIVSVEMDGYHDEKVVGMGLLRLQDPLPMSYPLIRAQPAEGRLVVEIRHAGQQIRAAMDRNVKAPSVSRCERNAQDR